MASTAIFVIMVVIACLLLLTASITASVAASDAFSSSYYATDSRIRSAHQYLTIAAALGWSALVVLIVILMVAAFAGGFTTVEVSDLLLQETNPSKGDLLAAYRGEKELSAGYTSQIIVLIVLIIVALITFIVGVLSVVAAIQIGNMPGRDPKADSAYTESIIAAVSGVGGIGIMLIAIIAYIGIRRARDKQLKRTEAFVDRAEKQLGITQLELPQLATTTIITKS